MNMDPLIAAELQIFVNGLLVALVGWYFLRREKKGTHAEKQTGRYGKEDLSGTQEIRRTSATKVSPTP